MATPIINLPQVGILDFEAVIKRPVVVTDADGNDSIAIRPMTILGLSWDHRALDGALSAQFLATVKRLLESVCVSSPELWVCHLGVVEYGEALVDCRSGFGRHARQDELPDVLLTLEHPPVYTRGRRSRPGELPMGEEWYLAQGIEIVETDRGGLVTYHGPGQLVGYPIVRVDDVVAYVRTLENALGGGAGRGGRDGARSRPREGHRYTGVWVEERKIASIGVHLSRGRERRTASPSTWRTTCSRSRGSCRAGWTGSR